MGKRRILATVLTLVAMPTAAARAAPALDCPAGTRQQRAFYADEFWCARADGTRHGPYRNGWAAPIEAGGYRDGQRDGWWRRWSNGVLVDERRYDRDREDGLARTWSEKGVLLSSGVMSRGTQVGVWRMWHENGRLAETCRYRRGEREGRRTEWDDDGAAISDGIYRHGRQEGIWLESNDATQARGRYARGEREGQWTFTFEGKRSAVGSYRHGWREGVWTIYGFDGERVEARGRYHRGRKEGTWILRDAGGKADSVIAHCRRGEPHGRFLWRQRSSDERSLVGYEIDVRYTRGYLNGWWTERFPPGAPPAHAASGLYRDGTLIRGEPFELADVPSDRDGVSGAMICEEEPGGDYHAFGDRSPYDGEGDDE